MNDTIVGVDLAKNVIQVCFFMNKKVLNNKEMTPSEFTDASCSYLFEYPS